MGSEVKYYLVIMGENFEDAVRAHQGKFYSSVEAAKDCAFLLLAPHQSYMICDENGGAIYIGRVPRVVGNS